MGIYINPDNTGFATIAHEGYVDKTGLIPLFDRTLCTSQKLVCVTRPRRFGKTFAAEALVAYYSCGCDSRALFEHREVGRDPSFEHHLNTYNVVRVDVSEFLEAADVSDAVTNALLEDLQREFPDVPLRTEAITLAFHDAVTATKRPFIFIIDEWDAPLREQMTKASQKRWIHLLRLLFKNSNFTPRVVAGAYMTGILPIVRYGTESALSDFDEYTMLAPDQYAPYVGFTEDEVQELAKDHDMSMDELRHWYDGYELPYTGPVTNSLGTVRCYAPYSVIKACQRRRLRSYWANSEAFRSLCLYVDLDFDGLQQAVLQALGGAAVAIDIDTFANDMHEIMGADDVLTLLCHLGYLAYDYETGTARIPNKEVHVELQRALGASRHPETARIVQGSDELLQATWNKEPNEVAEAVKRAHDFGCAPKFYNSEEALRAVVKLAYLSAADHYAIIEELPSGRGIADVVFLPRRGNPAPAMVVELKWNKAPEAAIAQIKNRDYPAVLRSWGGRILLVGITYDPKAKTHDCLIEEV